MAGAPRECDNPSEVAAAAASTLLMEAECLSSIEAVKVCSILTFHNRQVFCHLQLP